MSPNVKYELQEIERIISEGEDKPEMKESFVSNLDEKLGLEVERIKKILVHEVFSFEDERHLERYIQFHQIALIGLLDRLDMQCQERPLGKQAFCKMLYNHLDDMLRFIERHFVKYFDQDSKAPEGYLTLARRESKESIEKLTKTLTEKKADGKLLSLLLHVLQNIVDSTTDRKITFRRVMYAKEMQKELFLLAEKNQVGDINEELRQIMYYLNYNSVRVVTYHAHYISALLESTELRTEKIEKLSLVMKNISQAQVKPAIKYNQKSPPLKEQLIDYVSVEMEYQERLQRLNSPSSHRPDSPLIGFKLKFDASVSQLAYLIKIFIETKLIANSNLTHILQFLTMFAITKKSESISFSSFRTKFYNVETGTKESVRLMLTSMIHYIDRS
jgi:hypothetical protein